MLGFFNWLYFRDYANELKKAGVSKSNIKQLKKLLDDAEKRIINLESAKERKTAMMTKEVLRRNRETFNECYDKQYKISYGILGKRVQEVYVPKVSAEERSKRYGKNMINVISENSDNYLPASSEANFKNSNTFKLIVAGLATMPEKELSDDAMNMNMHSKIYALKIAIENNHNGHRINCALVTNHGKCLFCGEEIIGRVLIELYLKAESKTFIKIMKIYFDIVKSAYSDEEVSSIINLLS